MIAQAQAEQPNECCGLLTGVLETPVEGEMPKGRVVMRLPLVNALASPTRYQSEARSLFTAMKTMREARLDLLAVYHSHPTSAPIPSRIDLADNPYEDEVVHLIISLETEPPRICAWRLTATSYREEDWEVIDDAAGSLAGGDR